MKSTSFCSTISYEDLSEIFSFISRIILLAVFGPIPGIKLKDLTSSEIILSLKLETDTFDRRFIAGFGPIPDT